MTVDNLNMKKYVVLFCLFQLNILIFLREISDDDLREFIVYKMNVAVSPFANNDKIQMQDLRNYLPIKLNLMGKPNIQIMREDLDIPSEENETIEENPELNEEMKEESKLGSDLKKRRKNKRGVMKQSKKA